MAIVDTDSLNDLQNSLSIIAISKSITAEDIFDGNKRNSATSNESPTNFTPQQLAADLASYQV